MLTLKIVLVPCLVALASLLSRRYGPAVGGWLVGFPLVAGPILFFLGMKAVVPAHMGPDKVDRLIEEEMGHVAFLTKQLAAL